MLSKTIFVLGCVIFATQALSFNSVKIEEPTLISTNDVTFDEDTLPTLQEILEILKDLDDLLNFDREELMSIVATIVNLVSASDAIELRRCLLNIFRNLDREESKKYLQVLRQDGPKLIRLNIERRNGLEECNLIGGERPTALQTIQKRRCIAELEASVGTQITIVTIRLRPAVNYYRAILQNMAKCIGMDILPSKPWGRF